MKAFRSLFVVVPLTACLAACPGKETTAHGGAPTGPTAAPMPASPAPSVDKLAGAEPLLVAGKPTGYVVLPNQLIARRNVQDCPSQLPTRGCPNVGKGAEACRKDSDCQQGLNGYCHRRGLEPGCSCDYGCVNDEQCGPGRVCVCSNPVGVCVESECDEKTECPAVCATYLKDGGYAAMACRDHAEPPTRSD